MDRLPPDVAGEEGPPVRMEFTMRPKLAGETKEEYWDAVLEFAARTFQREFPGNPPPADPTCTPSCTGSPLRTDTTLKRYTKTSGAADGAGERYESKMLTLVFLRMLGEDLEFELASNVKDAGKYDDVVVWYRKDTSDHWKVTCVQLKHRQHGKDIPMAEFLALSGNFSLVQYCSSYMSVSQDLDEDTEGQFIVYSNGGMDVELVDSLEPDQLFNTGGQAGSFKAGGEAYLRLCEWVNFKEAVIELHGHVEGLSAEEVETRIKGALERVKYENKPVTSMKDILVKTPTLSKVKEILLKLGSVSSKDEYASVLPKIRVYVGQAHESELDAMIEEALAEVWICSDGGYISDMSNNLRDKIQAWWEKDNFYLTRDSQLWMSVVNTQVETLSKSTLDGLTKTGVEFQESCLQIIYNRLESDDGIFNLRVDSRTAASSLKVRQSLAKFGGRDVNVVHVNVNALLAREEDVLSAWASRWCPMLVVECDDELDRTRAALFCEGVAKVFGKGNGKLLVLIASEQHSLNCQLSRAKSYSHFHDNVAWNDLTDGAKESIYFRNVFLNDRPSTLTLREVVGDDKDFVKKVGLDAISQFVAGDIRCGKPLDEESGFFVTRRLQRSVDGVPFAVNSVSEVSGKVVLLVAEPGMGKSTLFAHLARSAKAEDPKAWIVHIKLNDCVQYLKEIDEGNFSKEEVDKFFEQAALSHKNVVEKLLFGLLERQVFVFVDGVDEVCPHYEKQVFMLLSFVKEMEVRQLWVASRPVLQAKLAGALQVETLNLSPFSKTDQTDFFNKFWATNVPSATPEECEAATTDLLAWLTDSLGTENSILGVPLMNAMIAEKFQTEMFSKTKTRGAFKTNKRLDVMDLYTNFLQMKFDLYCLEKKKAQHRDLSSNQGDEEKLLKLLHYNHRLAALWVLLSPEEFAGLQIEGRHNTKEDLTSYLKQVAEGNEKTGIIDNVIDGVPKFVHRSFAEFFVASWLADNYKKNRRLIERIMFDPTYKVVNEMFSRSLAEGHVLQVAVLNRNLAETKTILSSHSEPRKVDATDKGGRTALHLAVLFSATDLHPIWTDIMEWLVHERKASLDIADMVLGWRPLQYAVRTAAWKALQVIYSEASLLPGQVSFPKPDAQLMLDAARYSTVQEVRFLVENCGGRLNCVGLNGETMVHSAARGGNVETLKYLTSKGLSLKVEDSQRNTALRFATPLALSYLLENGLDLEQVNERSLTALTDAAQDGDYEAVAALLEKHASYEVSESSGTSRPQLNASLLCAAFAGKLEPLQELVRMGAWVKHQDKKKNTASMIAMARKHYEVAYWLMVQECGDGKTALGEACRDGNLELVSFLLSQGVDIEEKSRWGDTPLNLAVGSGHVDIVKLLLGKGASLECCKDDGRTPLCIATSHETSEMVKLLLEMGASVECRDNKGRTALHNAAYDGKCDMVNLLLEKGASVECCDNEGWTPLHRAAIHGKSDMVELLLENGANVECRDKNDRTLLHKAASSGMCDMVKLFVEMGLSVECCDNEGRTPLHHAALSAKWNMVELLLELGASAGCRDVNGRTPLHQIASYGQCALVELLLEKGASVNCRDSKGVTPIHTAARSGKGNMITLLLELGATLECSDSEGRTPLHHAALAGEWIVANLLLESGASPQCRDNEDKTPLDHASSGGYDQIVSLLLRHGAKSS